MIDLHCHILPGIDDGAKDLNAALKMAEAAMAEGIRHIAATPHHNKASWDNPADVIRAKTTQLNEALVARGMDIRILPGQEVHVNGQFWDEWQAGRVQAIGNSRYVLIEFPFTRLPHEAEEVVYELVVAGHVPVIAHPERNQELLEDLDKLANFVQMGALGQLTTHSLCGAFGRHVKRLSEEMIRRGLVHVIASDAHNLGNRGFRLQEAFDQVARKFGDACMEAFRANAKTIAADGEVEPDRSWPVAKRRIFKW